MSIVIRMKDGRYPSLNGLRAISIIMVIIHHIQVQYSFFTMPPNPVARFLMDGQFGVNVFFVISGFLITSLLLKEEARTGTIYFKGFFIRRALRILPAYFFLLLFYYCLTLAHVIGISNQSWITALTFTKYFVKMDDWYTHHAWSLSIEEHFYILWPLFFILGKKARMFFAYAALILPVFVRTYVYFYPVNWIDELTIFIRIDAIAIGCIVAIHQEKIITWFSGRWNLLFYSAVSIILLLPYINGLAKRMDMELLLIPFGITTGLIANVMIAIVLVYSVFKPDNNLWHKFLNTAWMNTIGLWSYSLYLWQQFFLCNSGRWINAFPQNIFLMVAVACFSYYIIEKPFLTLKSKWSAPKPASPVT